MALQALSKRAEIRAAFDAFKRALTVGLRPLRRIVGYPGGSNEVPVYWLPKEQFWCVLERRQTWGGYWCFFGLEDPHKKRSNLTITCQINSPLAGVDRNMAGAFLRDSAGKLSVAHSGKIGGGRKGIGQTAFLSQCRCEEVSVSFADGQTSEMLLVGAIQSAKIRAEVAYFVREVQRVKTLIVEEGGTPTQGGKFTPEFSGKKRSYKTATDVESEATHGLVVGELAEILEARDPQNDRNRDLYLGGGKQPTHLFEVKTDLTTTSIYTGIGQLMLHGASGGKRPIRISVLPGNPSKQTAKRLESLRIRILKYRWEGAHPVITGVSKVL